MATTTSSIFSINWQDAIKGFIVAAISAPLTLIYTSLDAGTFTLDWKKIGLIAATAGLSYIVKNFLTPSTVVSTNTADSSSIK